MEGGREILSHTDDCYIFVCRTFAAASTQTAVAIEVICRLLLYSRLKVVRSVGKMNWYKTPSLTPMFLHVPRSQHIHLLILNALAFTLWTLSRMPLIITANFMTVWLPYWFILKALRCFYAQIRRCIVRMCFECFNAISIQFSLTPMKEECERVFCCHRNVFSWNEFYWISDSVNKDGMLLLFLAIKWQQYEIMVG